MANKKLILVIDDDLDIVDSVEVILTKNGFEVVKAMSGLTASRLRRHGTPISSCAI